MLAEGIWLACPAAAQAEHPAVAIAAHYAREGDDLSGINPYIVALFALNEVSHERNLGEVREFILWYLKHLNSRDRFGLSGTIDDYIVADGVERSAGSYDSADGYAGLFLHLVHQYVLKTNDVALVRSHWKEIERIARLLVALQDRKGLTRALPGSSARYLMDNCEVYGGLTGYTALRGRLGKRESAEWARVRNAVKRAVIAAFYDRENALFFWALDDGARMASSWSRFYPDAFAQLFPIYFGLLCEQPLLKQQLWETFLARHAASLAELPAEQRIVIELTRVTMEASLR